MKLTRDQRKALYDLCRRAGAVGLARAIEAQAALSAHTPIIVRPDPPDRCHLCGQPNRADGTCMRDGCANSD